MKNSSGVVLLCEEILNEETNFLKTFATVFEQF